MPNSALGDVQAERHALEQCVLALAGKSAALERWLSENEAKKGDGAPASPCQGAPYTLPPKIPKHINMSISGWPRTRPRRWTVRLHAPAAKQVRSYNLQT